MSVAIVDYGSGNLHSAHKAFERAAREAGLDRVVKVTSDPEDVARAEHIVLPGVGHIVQNAASDLVISEIEAMIGRAGPAAGCAFPATTARMAIIRSSP